MRQCCTFPVVSLTPRDYIVSLILISKVLGSRLEGHTEFTGTDQRWLPQPSQGKPGMGGWKEASTRRVRWKGLLRNHSKRHRVDVTNERGQRGREFFEGQLWAWWQSPSRWWYPSWVSWAWGRGNHEPVFVPFLTQKGQMPSLGHKEGLGVCMCVTIYPTAWWKLYCAWPWAVVIWLTLFFFF